jgi:predicted nucleic acid-binding protein
VNGTEVVVDTNILFSFLLRKESERRKTFLTSKAHAFFCPRFLFVELFQHKERLKQETTLDEDELLSCLHDTLNRVQFIDEGNITMGTWMEARRLCRGIDLKDTPFVALALHLDAELWTADEELVAGLKAKGFQRFFAPRKGD